MGSVSRFRNFHCGSLLVTIWIAEFEEKYLRQFILEDKLGTCADLEKQMEELVGTYFCGWTEATKSPERSKRFLQFANTTDDVKDAVELVEDRGQSSPATLCTKRMTFAGRREFVDLESCCQTRAVQGRSSQAVNRGDTHLAVFKIRVKYYCPYECAFVLSDGLIGDEER